MKARDFLIAVMGILLLGVVVYVWVHVVVDVIEPYGAFFEVATKGLCYSLVAIMGIAFMFSLISPLRSIEKRIVTNIKRYRAENFTLGVSSMFVYSFISALMLRLRSVPLSFWFIVIFIIGVVFVFFFMGMGGEESNLAYLEALLGCVAGTILGVAIGYYPYFLNLISPYR